MSASAKWQRTDTAAMQRWLRTPRTAQTPADYACAIEHKRPRAWHTAEVIFVVGFMLLLLAAFA